MHLYTVMEFLIVGFFAILIVLWLQSHLPYNQHVFKTAKQSVSRFIIIVMASVGVMVIIKLTLSFLMGLA